VYADGIIRDVGPFNQIGIGGVLLSDRAGDGHLSTTKVFLSLALHKVFGSHLGVSLGANAGFVQKKLDFRRLIFDDQWTGLSFDPDVLTQEPGTLDPATYYDIHIGGMLTWFTNSDNAFYAGFSATHILHPNETFYHSDNTVGVRPILHAGAAINVGDRYLIEPAFVYMRQKHAQEMLVGGNVSRLNLGPLTYILGGVWFRGSGDAIPVLGGSYNQVHFLISYDINLSPLVPATNLKGGLELSMKFIVACAEKMPSEIVVPCIRI
jgi:type IX secretion system PorP/SprF family membrane protein